MHDWTLVSIFVDWQDSMVIMTFKNAFQEEQLFGKGLVELRVPKREEWGPSISVNEVVGPTLLKSGNYHVMLEIQSGDQIEIEAKSILIPKGVKERH